MFKASDSLAHTQVHRLKKTIADIEKEIDTYFFQEATAKMLNGMMHILSLGASLPGFMPYNDSSSTLAIQRLQEQLETAKAELMLIEKIAQLSLKTKDSSYADEGVITLPCQQK